jgi:hypothetical protein
MSTDDFQRLINRTLGALNSKDGITLIKELVSAWRASDLGRAIQLTETAFPAELPGVFKNEVMFAVELLKQFHTARQAQNLQVAADSIQICIMVWRAIAANREFCCATSGFQATVWNDLAANWMYLWELTARPEAFEKALAAQKTAHIICSAPPGPSAAYFVNLVVMFEARFAIDGDVKDIKTAFELARTATSLMRNSPTDRYQGVRKLAAIARKSLIPMHLDIALQQAAEGMSDPESGPEISEEYQSLARWASKRTSTANDV